MFFIKLNSSNHYNPMKWNYLLLSFTQFNWNQQKYRLLFFLSFSYLARCVIVSTDRKKKALNSLRVPMDGIRKLFVAMVFINNILNISLNNALKPGTNRQCALGERETKEKAKQKKKCFCTRKTKKSPSVKPITLFRIQKYK